MQTNWQKVVELTNMLKDVQVKHWLHETLFTFNWWLLLLTPILSLIVWLMIVDKSRIFEIMTYGLFVEVFAITLDDTGTLLELWLYKHSLTPLYTIVEIHIILLPIIFMVIYQYCRTWRSFLLANTINAFVLAFVLEPLIVWLDIYEMYHWKYMYSVLPYILIAIICKWAIERLKQMKEHAG
jgi:hypothetical protein